VQQLRLRNIGGIIVIDFIDMEKAGQPPQGVGGAPGRAQEGQGAARTSSASPSCGLVQMTRKRTRESLEQLLTTPCRHCHGSGRERSVETLAYEALRQVQRELAGAERQGAGVAPGAPRGGGLPAASARRGASRRWSRIVGRAVEVEAAPELARGDAEVEGAAGSAPEESSSIRPERMLQPEAGRAPRMRPETPAQPESDGLLAQIVSAAVAAPRRHRPHDARRGGQRGAVGHHGGHDLLPDLCIPRPRHNAKRVREQWNAARRAAEASGVLWSKVQDRSSRKR
jgi:hypothetical protein